MNQEHINELQPRSSKLIHGSSIQQRKNKARRRASPSKNKTELLQIWSYRYKTYYLQQYQSPPITVSVNMWSLRSFYFSTIRIWTQHHLIRISKIILETCTQILNNFVFVLAILVKINYKGKNHLWNLVQRQRHQLQASKHIKLKVDSKELCNQQSISAT